MDLVGADGANRDEILSERSTMKQLAPKSLTYVFLRHQLRAGQELA